MSAAAAHVVGIVPHRERPPALDLARRAAAWLEAHGVTVRVPDTLADAAGLERFASSTAEFGDGLDLTISLGGDGTMLHAVQLVYPGAAPIVGVNVGQLGYLSELEPDELEPMLPRLVAGEYAISERMMLEVQVTSEGDRGGTWFALNEAVIEKQRTGHLIYLDVALNGSRFTSYAADGIIVATPTGTTAYSFSARGPIASPALRCMVVTPLSPHMLFDRSLVLAEDEEVELTVCNGRAAAMTVDGREVGELGPGDRVRCKAASTPLRLVSIRPREFHQILKLKFSLPDR